MPGSPTELTFTGPAGPSCLDAIHDLVDQLWGIAGTVDETDRMMFTTAVLEVANNIVTHSGLGTRVSISLALTADPSALRAEFCDDGPPAAVDLADAALPDEFAESGRGLALARMALDDFTYVRLAEMNRWRLERRRSNSARSADR